MSTCIGLRAWCTRVHLPYSLTATRSRRRVYTTRCASRSDKVVVISGPTGAGKTRLAFELAKRLNGEIISADSVQVYRGLDVGSAKPSTSERKEVPHHLLDILHPSEDYSVGQFYDDARQATKDVLDRGRVPIITGGTGLYLRWFVYGKPDVPKASPEISSQVYAELDNYQKLDDWDAAVDFVVAAGDPMAKSFPTYNWYRLRRSLEIIKSSGKPPSAFQLPYDSFKEQSEVAAPNESGRDGMQEGQSKDLDYDFMCFFLSSPRLDLYKSIDIRCEDMLSGSDGILTEAKWLLDIGLLPNSNSATRAIGYRQGMEYLLRCREQGGESSANELFSFLADFQKASRNFAKRQLTWFRNEPIYHWLDASKPMDKVLNFVYDAYHDQSRIMVVPDSLKMKKDVSNYRERTALKAYRPKNRYFVTRQDCADILTWIRKDSLEARQPCGNTL
ncbi:hypothetical protein RND81_12G216400 [Saponaria officinalis]|uniref:tRNA dimethylallyltransferase n=1 Tax=Saponaria officinalis TaxID=3572 RepID=A0AAW1HDT6_SAPOF